LLAAIIAATQRTVDVRAEAVPLAEMDRRAACVEPRPGAFRRALERAHRFNVIAECKRRSPSMGVLRADYDPAAIARGYDSAGAAAISVLTDACFFDGGLDHLAAVRSVTSLPVLRRPIIDRYQILSEKVEPAQFC
jgi:indole-3-glycerol phosphate synthase